MTITLDQVVAMAISNRVALDALGEALSSDLVVSNPYHRRIVEFADEFMLRYRRLPGKGDWNVWIDSLPEGMIRDGTTEALGRLRAVDLSGFEPEFFAEQALPQLKAAAARVARSRLNEIEDVTPETFAALAEKIAAVEVGSIAGLARLDEVDVWATGDWKADRRPTGLPTLDRYIGGWGEELWIVFADSGVGKSMLLQNLGAHAAQKGATVLHVTLELGLRSQIQRYYRQVATASRDDFQADLDAMKGRVRHWLRLSQGGVYLIEFDAYTLEPDALKRTVERVGRALDTEVDFLVLDYLDLMTLPRGERSRSTYEDLGRITHQLRSLCATFGITVLSASQAVRNPAKKDRLSLKDMGDSYNKVRGADGILSLVQTEEEREVYQGRLGLLKVRDSGGMGREVDLYINRELALIHELSHVNTEALMKRLGHLPAQLAARGGLAGIAGATP